MDCLDCDRPTADQLADGLRVLLRWLAAARPFRGPVPAEDVGDLVPLVPLPMARAIASLAPLARIPETTEPAPTTPTTVGVPTERYRLGQLATYHATTDEIGVGVPATFPVRIAADRSDESSTELDLVCLEDAGPYQRATILSVRKPRGSSSWKVVPQPDVTRADRGDYARWMRWLGVLAHPTCRDFADRLEPGNAAEIIPAVADWLDSRRDQLPTQHLPAALRKLLAIGWRPTRANQRMWRVSQWPMARQAVGVYAPTYYDAWLVAARHLGSEMDADAAAAKK